MQVLRRPNRARGGGTGDQGASGAASNGQPIEEPGQTATDSASGPSRVPRRTLDPAGMAVVVGSFLAMAGLIGGLLANALGWGSGGTGGVFVIGAGTLPWSAILFAGVIVTAIGGIIWASRLSSDYGALVGTAMVLALAFTVILGGWAGLKRTQQPAAASVAGVPAGSAAAGAVTGIPAGHDHAITDAGSADATGAIAGESAEGGEQFGGHSHGAVGPTSDQEARETVAMLAAAKRATAKYRNVENAKRDGYFQVTQFIPGLGLHYANLRLLNAGFDPTHPPILLYQPMASGALKLVGVAYSMPHGRQDVPPQGFPGGEDVWHYHTNLCFLPGGGVTIAPSGEACKAKRGVFQAKTAWLLHAWIWTANPQGVFVEENPQVF